MVHGLVSISRFLLNEDVYAFPPLHRALLPRLPGVDFELSYFHMAFPEAKFMGDSFKLVWRPTHLYELSCAIALGTMVPQARIWIFGVHLLPCALLNCIRNCLMLFGFVLFIQALLDEDSGRMVRGHEFFDAALAMAIPHQLAPGLSFMKAVVLLGVPEGDADITAEYWFAGFVVGYFNGSDIIGLADPIRHHAYPGFHGYKSGLLFIKAVFGVCSQAVAW